jgi:hypothetical protein
MAFVPVAGPFLAGAAVAVGFALGARAIKQGRIVRDPPDPNFREPVRAPGPQLDLARLSEGPFQARAVDFARVNEKAGSICGGMVSSLERAMGAEIPVRTATRPSACERRASLPSSLRSHSSSPWS